jgi:hypothetical protein
MQPMLSFPVEERMHILRRDGVLTVRSRRRPTDASTFPVERRSTRDV